MLIKFLSTLTASVLTSFSAAAFDQTAPFGLSWGPVDKVPRPSAAAREGNVTVLFYRNDRLPDVRDTEEVFLEVCRNEGLQEVVWISRFFSDAEERESFESIVSEGNRRYGSTETRERGITSWGGGQVQVARISLGPGHNRIIMVSSGPQLSSCSDEHILNTGH